MKKSKEIVGWTKEKMKECRKRWNEKHPDYYKKLNLNNRTDGKRDSILKRDNYSCAFCKIKNIDHVHKYGRELAIHHKDNNGYYSKHPNNNIDNLITLCIPCHTNIHIIRKEVIRCNDNKQYKSITDAGLDNNLSVAAVKKICEEKRKSRTGLEFRYIKEV